MRIPGDFVPAKGVNFFLSHYFHFSITVHRRQTGDEVPDCCL
jgi:hypothetical protein